MRFLGLLSCQQMTIVSLLCLAAFVSTSWVCVAQEADDRPSAVVECHWADDTLTIDGVADEKAWQQAQKIDNFRKPWLPNDEQSPRTATTARLLWDRESLYFFAEMEDTDVYANVRAHDGRTWTNDVLEVFLKPSADKSGYYEFQVNAAATVLDMFLPRRGSGGYERFKSDGEFRIEAKVSVNGSLNNWSDRDQSWSVEGRIPWRDLIRTGGRPEPGETWQFALARYDYSVDFEGPELSTTAPLTHRDFHRHEEYARLRFVRPAPAEASAKYGLKPYTRTSQVVGSPDPPLPYTVTRVLPKLMVSWPIGVMSEPGSRRLWIIDQRWPYGPSRLARTTSDPADSTLETLVDFGNAVAYDIAFHPKFDENGYVYIGMNGAFEGEKATRIVRYTVSRELPCELDTASAKVIIEWPSDGHNGGAICFGNDGMLYVTSGDGTSDSDADVVGQRLDLLTAKVLRIDIDNPSADRNYAIPEDNPFVDREDARPETWAYGLRNPWRIAADLDSGAIWVGNNGQDLWEQIYRVERGANYGWSVYEGSHPFYPKRKLGPTPVIEPTLEHPHSEARSLTGGVVYYGKRLPKLRGAYIYGDYSTGKIWAARDDGKEVVWHRELADTTLQITDFGLDADGELLILDHNGNGGIYTLQPSPRDANNDEFPRRLSETGLFRSVARHEVEAGVIPYTVNSPLWSDGAIKERFLALPPSTTENDSERASKIDVSPRGGWNFPDRTVLVKSFALQMQDGDPSSKRWIETRLFTKQQGEWVGYSYLWNDEQTDAVLVDAHGTTREFLISTKTGELRSQQWRYPSRSECMVCHSRAAGFVLGPRTPQMNVENVYNGVRANQLRVLEDLNLLRVDVARELRDHLRRGLEEQGLETEEVERRLQKMTATRNQRKAPLSALLITSPEEYPQLADPYDHKAALSARARSYLHANCAHCHQFSGGGNSQIDLRFHVTRDGMKVVDVRPQHHKFGIDDARLIAPGDPSRSVLYHRVAKRGQGQMPQLATYLVDEKAAELLCEWIAETPEEADANTRSTADRD